MPKTRRATGKILVVAHGCTSHDPAGGVDVVVVEHVAGGPGAAGGLAHAPMPVAIAVPVAAVVVAVAAVRAAVVAEVAPRGREPQRRAAARPELRLLPAPPHLAQHLRPVHVPRHCHLLHRHAHLYAVHSWHQQPHHTTQI
jgi:hypothetical protein